jgi:hypothetical protein
MSLENSAAVCKAYGDSHDKLQTKFREQSLRLSRFHSVDWRVDYVISSSEVKVLLVTDRYLSGKTDRQTDRQTDLI